MLHLVGSSKGFSALNASRQQSRGSKVRLAQGVYCDDEDLADLPGFMRANAVRIANYLYPDAVLIQSSAYYKGPVEAEGSTPEAPKYKMFLAGKYTRTTSLQYLEIVQNDSLKNREILRFCDPMSDGQEEAFGKLHMMCASNELVFIQNFGRRRYNPERFLSDREIIALRKNLEQRHGTELYGRLMMVCQGCSAYGEEFARATEMLRTPLAMLQREETIANVFEFTMGWCRRPIAKLTYNGVSWSFDYLDGWMLPLQSEKTAPGHNPAFINNLFPEGVMRDMFRSRLASANAHATILQNSERFLTNISIVEDPARLKKIPLDILEGKLKDHSNAQGVFEGTVYGVPNISRQLITDIGDLMSSKEMLRISGTQAKIPVNLSTDGDLSPAIGCAATHILKLPGLERDPFNLKGVIEWASMSLAKGSGMKCADFALVELEGDVNVLGYVTERFDIPVDENDMRMIFAEDFCAAVGLPPDAKGMPPIEDMLKVLNAQSTNLAEDGEEIFKQFFVNYLLENADFHFKNASLIKIADPALTRFKTVRLAPAYDIMRTHYFARTPIPADEREPMQLAFTNGHGDYVDREITIDDFVELGAMCGVAAQRAHDIMIECATGITRTAQNMADDLPDLLQDERYEKQRDFVLHTLSCAVHCCHQMYPELPAELSVDLKTRKRALRRA